MLSLLAALFLTTLLVCEEIRIILNQLAAKEQNMSRDLSIWTKAQKRQTFVYMEVTFKHKTLHLI